MNGPGATATTSSMYSLKTVVSVPKQIGLPQVMYQLPKIQGASIFEGEDDPAAQFSRQSILPEYSLLEARQTSILRQIFELKEQIEILSVKVRLSDINKPTGTSSSSSQKAVSTEIIVYAHSANPPYSILALQRIWKDTNINVETHRHSSVNDDGSMSCFEEKLLKSAKKNAVHNIDLKLIWKDVPDVQFVIKVYEYPFQGEANLLRYLTRLIENYNYENSKPLTESSIIDEVLDLCHRLPFEEPKNIHAITAKIASHLHKAKYLLNSADPTIVDVAAWSIIKRVAYNTQVPRELKNWYDLCEKIFTST